MSTKCKRHMRYLLYSLGSAVLITLFVLPIEYSAAAAKTTGNVKQCMECHDDTTYITGPRTAWEGTLHATGTSYLRGTSASCAGCHSGGAFSLRVAEGLNPEEVSEGDPNPTRQDCRACHQIHVYYNSTDFALETTAPVELFATPGFTFDKGKGNLCAECHQARRDFPGDGGTGTITGINGHWGPHHGPQSAMMLGLAGSIPGAPATHYTSDALGDSCVSCHMANSSHALTVNNLSACVNCHGDTIEEILDDSQAKIQVRLDILGKELVDQGLLTSNDEDGHPVDGLTSAPANQASALWNWLYIAHEDKSLGVHNPVYTSDLLNESCSQLEISCP